MQTYARVVGGVVVELIEINGSQPIADLFHSDIVVSMVKVPDGVEVAEWWLWDGETFSPPAEPVQIVPAAISRRQMLLALVAGDVITPEEALAAATTGDVPAAIDAVFGELTPDDALAARITWATMSVVERAHPLIAAMIDAELVSEEDADALFVLAATL